MEPGDDPFDLKRFLDAQTGILDTALAEVRRGRKSSHWMWFVFPQIAGLAASSTAARYAIASLDEAKAYLAHPVLGARLKTIARAAADLRNRSALEVFGRPDDLKFCSSLTLFEAADPDVAVFGEALDVLCAGRRDALTLDKLRRP